MTGDIDPGLSGLRRLTAARIGLARTGGSLATAPLLDFRLAHARARDAVQAGLDLPALRQGLAASGAEPLLTVRSAAPDRRAYLMRPELGRTLEAAAAAVLGPHAGRYGLAVVLGDGLSALALQRHAAPLLARLLPALRARGWSLAPTVLVHGARVRVGDAVAGMLGAGAVLMLLGERPGLSAPDSLGAYLTWSPHAGTTDAGRNCVSNIRPEGLGYEDAAFRIEGLLRQMRRLQTSGVAIKDTSQAPGVIAPGPA